MTTAVPLSSYDQVAYPGKPYLQTHPDRLAVIARLFGFRTHDVAACRMLEIGCGDATNLIGMAALLPGAKFVGIDLSESAIARGQSLARQAGLKNVTLIPMDLSDFSQGHFDYIVAHGLYSWVPAPVRNRLMEVCAQRLRPQGVAMISYAAYPGGFIEQLIRAPMLFHSAQIPNPKQKVDAARSFAQWFVQHAPSGAVGALYREEWGKIALNRDSFLLHDQLGPHYTPVYFTEFIRHAAQHGLRYLGEANLGEIADPAARKLAGSDRIAAEQYSDFLRSRRFRQTILCREDASILDEPDASALGGCYASAPCYLADGNANLPALEAAWPSFVPCEELHAGEALLRLFAAGRIDLRTVPPPLDDGRASRPRATALARAQAALHQPVTNLLHHEVTIEDEFTRKLLTMLDGRRTRRELIDELARRSKPQQDIAREITRILAMLAQHALLLAAPS